MTEAKSQLEEKVYTDTTHKTLRLIQIAALLPGTVYFLIVFTGAIFSFVAPIEMLYGFLAANAFNLAIVFYVLSVALSFAF